MIDRRRILEVWRHERFGRAEIVRVRDAEVAIRFYRPNGRSPNDVRAYPSLTGAHAELQRRQYQQISACSGKQVGDTNGN